MKKSFLKSSTLGLLLIVVMLPPTLPSCRSLNTPVCSALGVHAEQTVSRTNDAVLFCDSIHTHDSTFTSEHQRGDTIYRERVVFRDRIEYRDRWRTRVQRDTIINVRVEKEIVQLPPERYIPKFYKRSTMILWTVILFALICGVWRWYKKKTLGF